MVKQKMARVNIHILGISEIKWTGMDKFNSGDHNIYYCGQESLRRNEVAIIVNKRVQNSVLGCNLKNDTLANRYHLFLEEEILILLGYSDAGKLLKQK